MLQLVLLQLVVLQLVVLQQAISLLIYNLIETALHYKLLGTIVAYNSAIY